MPPSRIAGAINAKNPSRKLRHNSPKPAKRWRGKPWRSPITTTITISDAAISRPGMQPARNSRPTEMSEVTPKMTIGRLGGTIAPMVAAAAVIEAAVSGR